MKDYATRGLKRKSLKTGASYLCGKDEPAKRFTGGLGIAIHPLPIRVL